jgi:hypothetical protein
VGGGVNPWLELAINLVSLFFNVVQVLANLVATLDSRK